MDKNENVIEAACIQVAGAMAAAVKIIPPGSATTDAAYAKRIAEFARELLSTWEAPSTIARLIPSSSARCPLPPPA